MIKKIFLPFHSTKKSGTGLGLSIVSRLSEAMNGRVEVSSNPGEGTHFRLYFQGLNGSSDQIKTDRTELTSVKIS